MSIFEDDLTRLNFEDYIWIIFIVLGILNIVGDKYLKNFLKTNNKEDENVANKIFLFILIISLLIYIYFFIRNVNAFEKSNDEEKELFFIKVFGSVLFIGGIICLIYFQYNQTDFIGTPLL